MKLYVSAAREFIITNLSIAGSFHLSSTITVPARYTVQGLDGIRGGIERLVSTHQLQKFSFSVEGRDGGYP